MRRIKYATLSAWIFLLVAAGCGGEGSDVVEVQVAAPDGATRLLVAVDVASDDSARRAGLSGYASLPPGQGLLIVLPIEGETCISNREVGFAIDAVFADDVGEVVAVESDIAAHDATLRCHAAVRRILEVGAGEAAEVRVGDRLIVS